MYYSSAKQTIEIRLDPDVHPNSGTLDPDRQQNLIDWSLVNVSDLQKILSKSVHNLGTLAAECQFTPYLLMAKNPGK